MKQMSDAAVFIHVTVPVILLGAFFSLDPHVYGRWSIPAGFLGILSWGFAGTEISKRRSKSFGSFILGTLCATMIIFYLFDVSSR
jgi:hypothetical protein